MSDIYSQLNFERIVQHNRDESKRAKLRNHFYSADGEFIKSQTKSDMFKYMPDVFDLETIQYITIDDFVKAFLMKISHVHKRPIIIKFPDDVDAEELNKFNRLMSEVNIHRVLHDAEMRTKLHNTLLLAVRYYSKLDKLYLDSSFDAEQTGIIAYDGMETEERLVVRSRYNRFERPEWIVWDRENLYNYRLVDVPKYDLEEEVIVNMKYQIDSDAIFQGEQSYYPFVKFQYEDQNNGYWGNGMDGIITLARIINLLYTVSGDDAIAETIRILMLNFDPIGVDGAEGSMKVGLRNPIIAKTRAGEEARAEIISADLYIDEIITLIDKIIDQFSALHGIDNVLSKEIKAEISATSQKLRNETSLHSWQRGIEIFRPLDTALIKKIVKVNNYHREKERKVDEGILDSMTLNYAEPDFGADPMTEYNLERLKWEDGVSSPVLYIMRQNPEFDEIQARAFIQGNRQVTNEVLGINVSSLPTGSEQFVQDIV